MFFEDIFNKIIDSGIYYTLLENSLFMKALSQEN
jgi:hypothetical protein